MKLEIHLYTFVYEIVISPADQVYQYNKDSASLTLAVYMF